jgi:hypothetical protein
MTQPLPILVVTVWTYLFSGPFTFKPLSGCKESQHYIGFIYHQPFNDAKGALNLLVNIFTIIISDHLLFF